METTRAILAELLKTLAEQYAAQLAQMPMKKATRETLVDGFKDGARSGVQHVLEMLGVEVKD